MAGRRIEDALPGRQGRLLFAYLAAHRLQPSPRALLLDVLWPDEAPASAEGGLAALLTKVRRVLGPDILVGKQDLRLVLPEDAWLDSEAASEALHRAESAVARGDWADAWGPARVALHIAARGFMPGYDAPWISEQRHRMDETLICAHECVAASGLGLGGPELAAAERSARRLADLAPLRESGYRLLMRALAAQDNIGEALMVYEQVRRALRDSLGTAPGAATQALHKNLLAGAAMR